MTVAQGSIRRGDGNGDHKCVRRIVVSFDDETFEEIRQLAVEADTSFAEQVRVLVELGMETVKLPSTHQPTEAK